MQQMNPMQMISEFMKFKNSFTGNAREEVQKLVNQGKINQQQLNQLQSMATQFQQMFNIR